MAENVAVYPDLAGKRVLVTGGSAGIGAATALAFSAQGATVTVLGRRLDRLKAIMDEMKTPGFATVADLSVQADCKRGVAEAIEQMGGLDIVVNNGANFADGMEAPDTTARPYEAAFQLHVASIATIMGAALPELIKHRGNVVNVSSVLSLIPFPAGMPYCVAKAAQDSLTRNWALKYAQQGVRINSVQPGSVNTENTRTMAEKHGMSVDDVLNKAATWHPLGRASTAEEQAAVILFLASDSAKFMTGNNLLVDGGAVLGHWFNEDLQPANEQSK